MSLLRRAGPIAALASVGLGLALGCTSFTDLVRTEGGVPSAERCGQCHQAVYREWAQSPHARAFLSPTFLARTDGGEVDRCLPCHAPGDLRFSKERPHAPRAALREEGVTCSACHRTGPEHGRPGAGTAMAGPLRSDALVQPHPIDERPDWFRDAALCGRCHEDSYAEWRAAPPSQGKVACQECHMPAVRRKVTQPTDLVSDVLVAFEQKHLLRAHDFSTRAAAREGPRISGGEVLEISRSLAGEEVQVEVRNLLPHAVPTGGFGRRRVVVEVLLDGKSAARAILKAQGGGGLPPGGVLRLRARVEPSNTRVEVIVAREESEPAGEVRLVLASRAWPLSPSPPGSGPPGATGLPTPPGGCR